jgi:hypothetical protein
MNFKKEEFSRKLIEKEIQNIKLNLRSQNVDEKIKYKQLQIKSKEIQA